MNYLFLLALCLAFIGCSYAAAVAEADAYGKYNGQPGCKTEEEISVGSYPHFYRKNVYWICETLGVPARLAYCPVGTGFLNDARECVEWPTWYWSPTELPPSQAGYGGV